MNTDLQSKQKSTIKPNKQLTSDLFGNQQNIVDEINISDSEDWIRDDSEMEESETCYHHQ